MIREGLRSEPPVASIVLTSSDEEQPGDAVRHGAQDFIPQEHASTEVLQRAIFHAQDRSERQAHERETTRLQELTERWEALGRMAAGVSHELNNHLTAAVIGLDELHQSDGALSTLPAPVQATLAEVRRSLALASARCAELRVYTGTARGHSHTLDLHELLPDAVDGGVAPAVGDPDQLRILIGDLRRIVARWGRPLPPHIGERAAATEGMRWVLPPDPAVGLWQCITLGFQGKAPDLTLVGRTFEPFQLQGDDTGSAIITAVGIVRSHGGAIGLQRNASGGSLIVLLPSTSQADAPAPAPLPARPDDSDALRLLLVDDDDAVRGALTRSLRRRGIEVHSYPSAIHALDAIDTIGFDAIVSDPRMPRMTGLEFLRRMRAAGHLQPAVLITAYSVEVPEVRKIADTEVLFKPFELKALLDLLERQRLAQGA